VGAGTGSFSDVDGLMPSNSAHRFEYGTWDFGRYAGLTPLFDWYDEVGWDSVWYWMAHLTGYLKDALADLEGVRTHTPKSQEESSALTTLSIPGVAADRMYRELWEKHRIRLRVVDEVDGNRVSTAIFNTEEEIDLLVRSLRDYLPAT